ncbi:hypothetical protein [Acinetobacter bohemicus]|uniref:hypothetical protein n=1 Tax=Acinetobacter bohemicus TaxID=1435036 RepID=UPI00192A9531|nr:hypothetical protein [Acinetobacter bohemicus]CAD9194052.1 hypothetical protein QAC21B_00138 [Acinetobacter bohemicus]CAD9195015.1 hypothetical protein QAC21B_01117 [Acinetobacter bohemicus]
MSNNKLASELVLTATENLADEFLFKTANTFLEDAIKSIPFASLITGSIETYSKFRTLKEQRQLLAFIQEAENINQGFIEKFFKDKNNTQLGFEILGVLDQTYLEQQAKMIGRVTLLFKGGKISKQDFDKYTYIITRLNSHLILLIDELYSIETNQDDPEFEFDIENPNMEFSSFQFLIEVPSPLNLDGKTKIARYKRTNSFFYFYENIFKD